MNRSQSVVWLFLTLILTSAWIFSPGQFGSNSSSPGIIKPVDQFEMVDVNVNLTSTPEPIQIMTPTPFPQEFLENASMTTGIAVGAVLLVLIVVVGTLVVITRKEK